MSIGSRGFRSSWGSREARSIRPELWLLAAGLVGMLLVEVWQSSRVAELSLGLEQSRASLVQAQTRMEYVQAKLEQGLTRGALVPVASQLRLAPADAQQVVALPAEYLAAGEAGHRDAASVPLLAWAERVSRAIVPEAKARTRTGN